MTARDSNGRISTSHFPALHERARLNRLDPALVDCAWANGWRNFGSEFVRYSITAFSGSLVRVIPLRVHLDRFSLTKSQRRIAHKNNDLEVDISEVKLTPSIIALFERHKRRFKENAPASIESYIGPDEDPLRPAIRQVSCLQNGSPLAVSYFVLGQHAVSSLYGCFEPKESQRSLGHLTMLSEIAFAQAAGYHFYYHGYCFDVPSFYDYKLTFRCLEAFDWQGCWLPLPHRRLSDVFQLPDPKLPVILNMDETLELEGWQSGRSRRS